MVINERKVYFFRLAALDIDCTATDYINLICLPTNQLLEIMQLNYEGQMLPANGERALNTRKRPYDPPSIGPQRIM